MFFKLQSLYKENYSLIYIFFISVFLVGLPHSRALVSSSQIGLFMFWLLDVNIKQKLIRLKHDKALLLFLSIFLMHILALLYTANFNYALTDIKVKLPLLLFPLVIGTSEKISYKNIKLLFLFFTISLLFKTFYGFLSILGFTSKNISDIQQVAGSFSHIRYSLMLNLAIFINLYFLFKDIATTKRAPFYILRVLTVFWLIFFVFILHSVTGWVILFVLSLFTGIYLYNKTNSKLFINVIRLSFSVVILSIAFLIFSVIKFYSFEQIDFKKIDKFTKSGNIYTHNFNSKNIENGHFVNIYYCQKELKSTWNKVANVKYWQKDAKGQVVKYTLIRYLTSKGYRKDKEGVLKLSKQDVKNIENGLANYIFENKFSIYAKLYEVIWQIDSYMRGGSAEKHSVTQRLEFLKVAKGIIRHNFFIGVGTGDVSDVFKEEYTKVDTKLGKGYQLRAHNQYITFFITFGIFGFLWFLFAYIYPAILNIKFNSYLFLVVFITMSLSMLNEDTLETQMGVSIFAFFISLFLFGYSGDNESI